MKLSNEQINELMLMLHKFLRSHWKQLVTNGLIDDIVTDTIMEVTVYEPANEVTTLKGLARTIAHRKAIAATQAIKKRKQDPLTRVIDDGGGDGEFEIPKAVYPPTQENDVFVQQMFGWIGKLLPHQANMLRELAGGASVDEVATEEGLTREEALALRKEAIGQLKHRKVF